MSEQLLKDIRDNWAFVPNGSTSYWLNEKEDGTQEAISPEEVLDIGCLRETEGKALVERLWTRPHIDVIDKQIAQLEEENKRLRGFLDTVILNWEKHRVYKALLADATEEQFCPACDAGVGHCNGPHNGSDKMPF